jgi:hypothetical protein
MVARWPSPLIPDEISFFGFSSRTLATDSSFVAVCEHLGLSRDIRNLMSNAKDLADVLADNMQYLSTLIARKPTSFTSEWAATPDKAFSLYTSTSTVNWILSFSNILAAQN